ncbi:MAG: ABC transporter permease [Dysgonamonadaceae bacterium]|jgi:ABC-2 type transport system permease protein|nr:ABC transporter permease [Dysgonamonadaceae bacterium]
MSAIKYLIEKEFKQIFRNSILPKLIAAYPVMILLIFPWTVSFEVKNIRVNVVDNDKNLLSQRLIGKINASSYFILNGMSPTFDTAFDDIDNGSCDMILEIPQGFDKDLVKENGSTVFIAANAVNGTQGLLGTNYLTRILNNFSAELRAENPSLATRAAAPRIEIVPNYRFNANLDYKSFMLPAFMMLIITLICGILPALNIVIEKETGTIQQINTTPVGKFSFIVAKLIPYWIIGFFILLVSFFLVWGVYGLFPSGNASLILLATVYIIGISGLGLIISNYSETLQQAMFLVMFLILIIILLSGLFSPIAGMPRWATIIAFCNPLSYAAEIMRAIYLKGAGFADVLTPLSRLLLLAIGLNVWAVLSYKKRY